MRSSTFNGGTAFIFVNFLLTIFITLIFYGGIASQFALICNSILVSITFKNIVAGILTAVIGCSTSIAMFFSALGDWQLLNPLFSLCVTHNYP